jgi:hypothetical protein
MGNPYQGMVGALAPGRALGYAAFGSSVVACAAFPQLLLPIPADNSGVMLKLMGKLGGSNAPVLSRSLGFAESATVGGVLTSVPVRLKLISTDTGQMMRAVATTYDSGEKGHDYWVELERLSVQVQPSTWEAGDQEEFQKKFADYMQAVLNTYCLEWDVALITSIVCVLRFVQLTIASVMAGILAVMSITAIAALCIPIFGWSYFVAIVEAGQPVADALRTVIQVMDQVMVTVAMAAGAIVAVRTVQAAVSDDMRLDTEGAGLGDLGQSVISLLGDMVDKYSKGITDFSGF